MLREIVRPSPTYYHATQWLRKHPPNEEQFTIRHLAADIGFGIGSVRIALRKYRNDSKVFLKYIPIPSRIKGAEEEWNWAINELHKRQGCFMVQPDQYHSSNWGEPTFRQFEDYNVRYFGEGLHRIQYRLQDAIDYNLTIDGINIRKELSENLKKQAMLSDYSDHVLERKQEK